MGIPGMPQVNQRYIPTPEEKAEAEKVRDMQVRTQAAALACTLHQPRATSDPRLMKTCKVIEEYIRHGTFDGDPLSSI